MRTKVGVGIILIKDGKILMGKRQSSPGAGRWAPPGGHLEFGETIETCARRELAEETGVVPLSQKKGPWTNDLMEERHYVTLFVFVHQFEGTPELLEPHKCEGWEWFDWKDLPTPLFLSMENLIKGVGIDQLIHLSSEKGQAEMVSL
jgi:8-oxo-dGTP diphosphatase